MSTTRDRILEHALARFNQTGIEAVGIRDIARELDMSPGNLSYHFPRKDDLVAALSDGLGAANSAALGEEPTDLASFMATTERLFANHVAYRCLSWGMLHLLEHNAVLRDTYRERELDRRVRIRAWISALTQPEGGLDPELDPLQLERLVCHTMLHARLWLTEARISFPDEPFDRVEGHYLHLLADLFLPYATPDGRAMLAPWLAAPLLDWRPLA